jgi:hypothetical protein
MWERPRDSYLEIGNEVKKIKVIQEHKQNRKQEIKHRMEKASNVFEHVFAKEFSDLKEKTK